MDLQKLLAAAYPGHAQCLCGGTDDGPRLQIRRRGKGSGASYHLARVKLEASRHAKLCRFGQERPLRGNAKSAISRKMLERRADGTMHVLSPQALDPVQAAVGEARSGGESTGSRGRARPSLRTIAYLTIGAAGLASWCRDDEPRTYDRIEQALRTALATIYLPKSSLEERTVYIPRAVAQDRRLELRTEVSRKIDAARLNGKRILLVGTVRDFRADPPALDLEQAYGIFGLSTRITLDRARALRRRYPSCRKALREKHGNLHPGVRSRGHSSVLAFLIVKARDGRQLEVIDGCLLLMSQNYVPVDSSIEQIVVDKLFAEKRCHSKPLFFDRSMSRYHPDLLLHDVMPRPFVLEIYGMETDKYLEHQETKTAYYDETYGTNNWWPWLARKDKHPPNFPRRSPTMDIILLENAVGNGRYERRCACGLRVDHHRERPASATS